MTPEEKSQSGQKTVSDSVQNRGVSVEKMQLLLNGLKRHQTRRYWLNFFKMLIVLFGAMPGAFLVTALLQPGDNNETLFFFLQVVALGLFGLLLLGINTVWYFWPFLLYFWVNLRVTRQRVMLTLIQAALETETSLSLLVQAYSIRCSSPWYKRKLHRFAFALEQGYSLQQSLNLVPGLLRHDIASILEIGGDDKKILETIEKNGAEEQSDCVLQSNTLVRIGYLLMLCFPMFSIPPFLCYSVIPQFEKIFIDFGLPLPPLTQFVISHQALFIGLPLLVLPPVALILLSYLILQTNVLMIRPIFFRRLFRSIDAARFLQIFNVGLQRQLPVPETITAYCRSMSSAYLKRQATRIAKSVQNGHNWIDAVRKEKMITASEKSLLESAEKTGNAANVLSEIAISKNHVQNRSSDLVSRFIFLPCIFFMALVVGTFVISMFLPLISLINNLSAIQ